jgi:hypothetical protein
MQEPLMKSLSNIRVKGEQFIKLHRQLLLACFILLFVSLITRFAFSATHVSFHQDMARDALLMENALEEGSWLLGYGPKASVWNFYLPPFYFQLHLLLTALSDNNPLVMMWAITLVESFTPILIFLILRFITNSKNALLAATIYLFSATVVSLGTRAWNPNMIPFFTALLVYGILQLTIHTKRWGAYVASFALLIGFQLHYQVALILPFACIGLLYAWYKKTISLKDIALLFLLSIATLSTYLHAEFTNNWQNTRSIFEYFSLEHSRYYDQVSKPDFVLKFLPGFIERVLFGIHTNYWLGRVLLLAGLVSLTLLSRKKLAVRVLLLFILTTFVMLRVYKGDKTDYYLSTFFMLPALLLAATIHYQRLVGMAFAVLIAGLLSAWMQKTSYSNDFVTLEPTFQELSLAVPNNAVQYLFHSDDDVNVFAYGLKHFGTLQYDANSTTVLEICQGIYNCSWDGVLQCARDRSYTYSSLLKERQPHTQKALLMYGRYFVITIFESQIQRPNYSLYALDNSYGTDTLLPTAYNW